MIDAETVMREALEGQFFHYVGKPDQLVHNHPLVQKQKRDAEARKRAELEAKLMEEVRVAHALHEKLEREHEARIMRVSAEPTQSEIIAAVAWAHRVTVPDLMSHNRKRVLTAARHHAIWELKQRKSEFSMSRIAHIFKRDHTTIINSLEWFPKNRHLHEGKVEAVARILNNKG